MARQFAMNRRSIWRHCQRSLVPAWDYPKINLLNENWKHLLGKMPDQISHEPRGLGYPVPPMTGFWQVTDTNGAPAGRISSAVYAFTYHENIAIGLIDHAHWHVDTELLVHTSDGMRAAKIRSGFPGRQAKS